MDFIEKLPDIAKALMSGTSLTYRTGEALKEREPEVVTINGVIDTPAKWLKKRICTIDVNNCRVEVDREKMTIMLIADEKSYYKQTITGALSLAPEYLKFGINQGDYKSCMELSDLIRMNRSYFDSKQTAMELVSTMRNFKARVTHDIEMSDDKRGNAAQVKRQSVEMNQPPTFAISIPIFKGQPKRSFIVEVDIDPDTLNGTLVSPDALDIIAEERDKLMDGVIEAINAISQDIPILEI